MKVLWTNAAIDHLVTTYEYIALDAPLYARRMVDRLTARSQQLSAFPQSGRVVPEFEREDIREVIERPYRIIYQITLDRILVLAVVHGARLLTL